MLINAPNIIEYLYRHKGFISDKITQDYSNILNFSGAGHYASRSRWQGN